MTELNRYAKKLDEMAKQNFTAFNAAERKYREAEETFKQYPERGLMDAVYAAKSAKARADYLEAKEAFERQKSTFRDSPRQFDALRAELVKAADALFCAKPEQMDAAALELLKSGILKSGEYVTLFEKAKADNNTTMARLIGRYAGEAANGRGIDSKDAATLRMVERSSHEVTGGERLETFDTMTRIYEHCVTSPGLIPHWDEFVSETVDSF